MFFIKNTLLKKNKAHKFIGPTFYPFYVAKLKRLGQRTGDEAPANRVLVTTIEAPIQSRRQPLTLTTKIIQHEVHTVNAAGRAMLGIFLCDSYSASALVVTVHKWDEFFKFKQAVSVSSKVGQSGRTRSLYI